MNIPENILQQVADEAFLSSNGGMMGLLTCNKEKNHVFWHEERCERRAVIQHAISNPALAPFLAGGIGEYTDSDIHCAWRKAVESDDKFVDRIRAFLDALPRRESQALVDLKSDLDGWKDRAVSLEGQVNEAITRAEKAEAELSGLLEAANEESRKDHVKYSQLANKLEGAQAEYAAIHTGQPCSGTPWLDEMIAKARRERLAGQALAGFVVEYAEHGFSIDECSKLALDAADVLIAELEGGAK